MFVFVRLGTVVIFCVQIEFCMRISSSQLLQFPVVLYTRPSHKIRIMPLLLYKDLSAFLHVVLF